MTNKEAIEELKKVDTLDMPARLCEAHYMAIKALEQEPKTGHWIEKDGFDGDVYYDCSECGESWTTIEGTPWQNGMDYCPNCGCRMFEPQESEDIPINYLTCNDITDIIDQS
jgi:hypothetical protein